MAHFGRWLVQGAKNITNGIVCVTIWSPNKSIDIGEGSIWAGGRLKGLYFIHMKSSFPKHDLQTKHLHYQLEASS